MKCTCHVGGIGEHLYSCSPPTIIEVPLPFFSEEERNLSFRRRKETFPSREMIHIHSLHIFIQLSFKSIIKFESKMCNRCIYIIFLHFLLPALSRALVSFLFSFLPLFWLCLFSFPCFYLGVLAMLVCFYLHLSLI
jgi:hypothetical protein